jgi:hypothetical protein
MVGQDASETTSAATVRWQERSPSSTCFMNIDNVTVGGYRRSRCSGWYVSVISPRVTDRK